MFSLVIRRYFSGLGSKSMTSTLLCFRFVEYRASERLLGFFCLFFPLFHVHSWLVHGVVFLDPWSVTWSTRVSRTATTWLHRPSADTLQGSQQAWTTAPLLFDKTTVTLCGKSLRIEGHTCARTNSYRQSLCQ